MSRRAQVPENPRFDAGRFILLTLGWLIPVAVVWTLLTPMYNHFLITAGENLLRLTERPGVSRLSTEGAHHTIASRTDLSKPAGKVRVTDIHFPLLMLAAFFLAVPGVPFKERIAKLGWALLASVFFHLISLVFWVKFLYVIEQGAWSVANYGAFARNFWGLGKHLLDLPFKFAWPLVMWIAFYPRLLLPERPAP
jgi:hypothetical protein